MSETVRSFGYVGVLKHVVPAIIYEQLLERIYDDESKVMFTRNGLVFIDYNMHSRTRYDYHGLWIGSGNTNPEDLVKEAYKYGLEVDQQTIIPYNCIWYNGGDCPLWNMKKEVFFEHLAKSKR